MGQEFSGTVTVGGQKVNVRGDFASDHVTFSGGRRGEVPYKRITIVSTTKGILTLRVDDNVMEFPVGPNVDRLANKIRAPPTLMEKLGIIAGLRVACNNVPKALEKEVAATAGKQKPGELDMLLLGVNATEGLELIATQKGRVAPKGAIWIVYPKAKRDIRESDVLAAGRAAGLKDVKVARISTQHTALKFMVPATET